MYYKHMMETETLTLFLLVALGGAIGAVLRYAVYRTVDTEFPWATFIVNIIGCTLAAFLMFRFGLDMGSETRTFLFVGIFGAFTTLSTFSIDTVNLFFDEKYVDAFANFVLNAVVCLAGAFIGKGLSVIC